MTNLYSRSNSYSNQPDAQALLTGIQEFLRRCRQPAVLEFGETVFPLLAGQYALEIRAGRLVIEIWADNRSLSRRIIDIERSSLGLLDCVIHRFGNKPGRLTFLDLARPQTSHRQLSGTRQNFGEQFRRMLTRRFPGWEVRMLSTSQDLRRSFSGVFPRAHLIRNHQHIAALACAHAESESEMLAFALIWLRHIRASYDAEINTQLALFLPQLAGNQTAQRLRWMNKERLPFNIYLFNEDGSAGEVDPADLGNLQTQIASQPLSPPSLAAVAGGPPERWLETVVRARISVIDPFLRAHPVHSQVITFAGGDRDMIDLLAVTADGRLCVLELKAGEDLQLPIQALDYWMRIAWHAARSELNHLFPGVALQSQPPKLILLAPAMQFHSTNTTLLRFFSEQIQVERVGVNTEWREELRVILRLQGAALPVSHET